MTEWTANPFAQSNEEYNPFDEGKNTKHGASAFAKKDKHTEDTSPDWATPASKPVPPSQPSKPEPGPTPVPQQESSSWSKQPANPPSQEMKPYAQDLQRQKEYQEREAMVKEQLKDPNAPRPANFPPFPKWMRWGPFVPCFHLDISGEIPLRGRALVRIAFYLWGLTFMGLFWNWICTLATLACDKSCSSISLSCFLASLWLVAFTPCSYCCWFNPLYNAVRLDSSAKYGWFFFCFVFQIVTSSFLAIGFPGTGGAGIWVASLVIKDDRIAGILVFSSAILWVLNALVCIVIMQRALALFRNTGGSVQKAQGEIIVGVASNKQVQGAVIQGATHAVQQQTY